MKKRAKNVNGSHKIIKEVNKVVKDERKKRGREEISIRKLTEDLLRHRSNANE